MFFQNYLFTESKMGMYVYIYTRVWKYGEMYGEGVYWYLLKAYAELLAKD